MKILSYIIIGLLVIQVSMFFKDKKDETDNLVDNAGELDEDDLV